MSCSCGTPCTGTPDCTCPVKDLSTDCSTYTGVDLVCSGISKDTIMTSVIIALDAFICDKFAEAIKYLTLINIGGGSEIYKGISGIGNKELRTIEQGDDIIITQEVDTVKISNPSATETVKGVAEVATQVEADALALDDKIITPAKLPISSETQQGLSEIATQAEADAGVDDIRYITPLKLKVFVANPVNLPDATETVKGVAEVATQVEVDALALDDKIITPAKLPISSETQQGLSEIATQAEADAGVDDIRYITPLKLKVFVANPVNLPDATETVKGVAEVATQVEVDALALDDKIITPAKLPISSETQQGLSEIATQAEADAGVDDIRYITPLKLKTYTDALPGIQELMSGNIVFGSIDGTPTGALTVTGDILTATKTNPGSSNSQVVITFASVGVTDYKVILNINSDGASSDVKGWVIETKTTTTLTIELSQESPNPQNFNLDVTLIN